MQHFCGCVAGTIKMLVYLQLYNENAAATDSGFYLKAAALPRTLVILNSSWVVLWERCDLDFHNFPQCFLSSASTLNCDKPSETNRLISLNQELGNWTGSLFLPKSWNLIFRSPYTLGSSQWERAVVVVVGFFICRGVFYFWKLFSCLLQYI